MRLINGLKQAQAAYLILLEVSSLQVLAQRMSYVTHSFHWHVRSIQGIRQFALCESGVNFFTLVFSVLVILLIFAVLKFGVNLIFGVHQDEHTSMWKSLTLIF